MADLALQRNDEAYRRVGFVTEQVAQRLQFFQLKWDETHDRAVAVNAARQSAPMLFRGLPHAFGLFAVQDEVRLFCKTSMSMRLLAEHIKEHIGLDDLTIDGTKIIIDHEQLAQQSLYLPNSLDLVIQHIEAEAGAGIPYLHNELMAKQYFDRERKGEWPIEAEELFTIYRRTYLQVRDWAHRAGILSGDCRFLSEELLTAYYTYGFFERIQDVISLASSPPDNYELFHSIVKSSEFARLSDQDYNRRASQCSQSQIPRPHRIAIQRAIERAAPPANGVEQWTMDALDAFIANHFIFIKLDARSWGSRLQGKLEQHRSVQNVRVLITSIQIGLDEHLEAFETPGYTTTFFPELNISTDDLVNLTFLIGISRPPNSSPHADNEVSAIAHIAAETRLQGEGLRSVDAAIQYGIFRQGPLKQDLKETRAIALSLPTVFRLHLDYTPLIDPLFQEEAQTHETLALTSNPQTLEPQRIRTSREVLNRLQWDTKHASNRFEIGYKDRFEKDLMWKLLEDWTKDEQAEDFIPMHRIYRFREIISKRVVWDRDKRIDCT